MIVPPERGLVRPELGSREWGPASPAVKRTSCNARVQEGGGAEGRAAMPECGKVEAGCRARVHAVRAAFVCVCTCGHASLRPLQVAVHVELAEAARGVGLGWSTDVQSIQKNISSSSVAMDI